MTQELVHSKTEVIVQLFILVLLLLSFSFFMYFVAVILSVYFTMSHVLESSRYILFAHMLINDTIYLILGLYLMLVSIYPVYHPASLCYILVTVTSTSFKVTPYNLAVMSLERYVAISFPLRHAEFCTTQRSGVAIAMIWAVGLIPNLVDFIILVSSSGTNQFSHYVICARASFISTSVQSTMRLMVHAISFSLVGLIIVYTYIKIMLVALKMEVAKASASKAGKTVMLHAFQLLLCMMAFSYSFTEMFLKAYITLLPIINFFLFMCLPRFLSPLIYGLRDEVFLTYIKKFVLCKPLKTDPLLTLD
ncbi:odorant receptor 131-2-like [Rhinophrynus dorsalis]